MLINKEKIDWRKQRVERERTHEPLVNRLCTNKGTEKALFPFNKDLMVFAAMVGHSLNQRKPLKGDVIPITLDTYSTDQKDSFIYLIALMEEKNGTILKDENLNSAIKIFEEYCNAGLYEIKLWLDENPGDHEGTDTIYRRIFDKIIENEKDKTQSIPNESISVEF